MMFQPSVLKLIKLKKKALCKCAIKRANYYLFCCKLANCNQIFIYLFVYLLRFFFNKFLLRLPEVNS